MTGTIIKSGARSLSRLYLTFGLLCAGALLTLSAQAQGKPRLSEANGVVRVEAAAYRWEWNQAKDTFQVFDAKDRPVVKGRLQPEIIVSTAANARQSQVGRVAAHTTSADSLTVKYACANGTATASLTLRFDATAVWFDPVAYESTTAEDIVEVRYFSDKEKPRMQCTFAVIPGIEDSAAISPIIAQKVNLNMTCWLGRGGGPYPGAHQQWGLPVHYFCGFERGKNYPSPGFLAEGLSDAFCCGLAELPAGDMFFQTLSGTHSVIISTRSDIWHHLRGPGKIALGAKLVFTFGADFRAATRAYYAKLVEAGIVQIPQRSAHKEAVMAAPQFNTWGDQTAQRTIGDKLTDAALTSMHTRLRGLGLRPGMFVIDDKWEGTYGNLEHSATRVPQFEKFLGQLRQEGMYVGVWAAFMRCENPAELGLTLEHMLRDVNGKPFRKNNYYLLDFTQPEVQRGLRERARRFIQRYHPDLVKFDFGYEIPSLALAAPRDMSFAGERMMAKGLEIIVEAMREENPDIVLMYYSLTPLLGRYIDLHSPDDLYVCPGEYDVEANRRFYFSSMLAEIGMPTYGSGGYDWESMPEIWFDSALIGTLGLLQPLGPDERGMSPTPAQIAKFNGLAQLLRPASRFRIEVKGDRPVFASTRAAHASSWARYEGALLTGVALRDRSWAEMGVEATAPLVLVTREAADIHAARQLRAVPYGQGEVKLQHAGPDGRVKLRTHLVGGAIEESAGALAKGVLQFAFAERGANAAPVEWIEITLE
ncbi:MAG: hypothetical protein HZA31_05990 [Opitutae bacterium]|nr:hypothetical protein [Opitutae bacterium]